jgi:hypothetical protein
MTVHLRQTPQPPEASPEAAQEPEPEPSQARAVRALGPDVFLSPEQVVRRAIFLAGVDQHDLVTVAGPDALMAMISLCRAGYERVECARQATCSCADEASDLLLVVGPLAADGLAGLVRRTAGLVRDGGSLVVQLTGPEGEARLPAAIAAAGRETTFSLIDRSAGRLVLLRVRRARSVHRSAA